MRLQLCSCQQLPCLSCLYHVHLLLVSRSLLSLCSGWMLPGLFCQPLMLFDNFEDADDSAHDSNTLGIVERPGAAQFDPGDLLVPRQGSVTRGLRHWSAAETAWLACHDFSKTSSSLHAKIKEKEMLRCSIRLPLVRHACARLQLGELP